jgi:hypothetical protein
VNNNDFGIIAGSVIGALFLWILYIAVIFFYLFCMWKIFVKAGKPGWAAIVPFYNIYVELEILGQPWWFLLLMFVPVANLVISIMMIFGLAKVFGKSIGFGFGMLFLSIIFIPILAFSDAKYEGPIAG